MAEGTPFVNQSNLINFIETIISNNVFYLIESTLNSVRLFT